MGSFADIIVGTTCSVLLSEYGAPRMVKDKSAKNADKREARSLSTSFAADTMHGAGFGLTAMLRILDTAGEGLNALLSSRSFTNTTQHVHPYTSTVAAGGAA